MVRSNNTRAKILIDDNVAYYGCVSADPRGDQDLFKHYSVELPPPLARCLYRCCGTESDFSIIYPAK